MTLYNDIKTQQTLQASIFPEQRIVGGFTGPESDPTLGRFEVEAQEEKEYSSTEILKAAFQTENTLGSLYNSFVAGDSGDEEEDPNYDIYDKVLGTKYEPYLENFADVFNDSQLAAKMQQIDDEEHNREILASSGAEGVGYMILSGILDPVNLIPIGGSAYKAFKTGKVLQGMVRGAQVAGMSEVAAEAVLNQTQELRTIEESAINVAGATILGGALGAGAAKLSKRQFDNLSKRVEADIQAKDLPLDIDANGNLSAARTSGTTLAQEKLAGGKITQAVIKSTKKLNPTLRVLESSTKKARDILQKTVRTNMYFKKNFDEIATQQSVEINVRRYDAGVGSALQANRLLFKQASKNKNSGIRNIKEFNDQVSLAMIRGDKHEVPEVQSAAEKWRREVFDPIKDEAISQGLLKEDVGVVTAPSYLMRRYRINKIIAQEKEFKDLVKRNARESLIPSIRKQLKKTEKALSAKQLEKLEAERNGLSAKITKAKEAELEKLIDRRIELDVLIGDERAINDYIDEIADSVFDNIRGVERKGISMPYDLKVGVRGPAKERVLNFIQDEDLRPFLETDIEMLAKDYTRILGTDVELKRAFGSLKLDDEFAEMKLEYDELRKKAKTEKERIKLSKEETEVRKILSSYVDIMRGDYGRPTNPDSFWPKAARISRSMQYMSKLGGVTLSSFPDIGRPVMIHGMTRVFGTGLRSLITNTKGFKLSLQDAKLSGQLMEGVTHHRAATLSDIFDPYSSNSAFERMIGNMSEKFTKFTFLDTWNDYQKGFSSVLTQQRMIENLNNFDKIPKKEKAYMAFLGIDNNNVGQIIQQLNKHGTKEGNISIANIAKWGDKEAARIYKNALNTDVDRTIVTKGVGDTPLLMNTELGKTWLQFKSFLFAAHQQVTIAGLQQADLAALSGITTMIAAGMLTYHLKNLAAGRESSDDPNVWVAEGIDRSGIMPVLLEMNNMADIFGVGAASALGQKQPLSRYATRNQLGAFAGPSFGVGQDVFQVAGALNRKDFSESDIRAIRKNLPLQNVTYLRWLFNEAEKAIAK